MAFDPGDGLTDELAAQIRADLEDAAPEEVRALAAVRLAADDCVELVAYDEDGESVDVVVRLTREQATALAAALADASAPG